MAARNIKVRNSKYGTRQFATEANVDVGLAAGDAVKLAGTGANFATICLDGDNEQGTDIFLGITKTGGSQTAAANGVVDVEIVGPGTVLSGAMNTPGNANTAALLLGIKGDYVCFDRSAATAAGVLTIDENEGSDNDVHSLFILDGDIVKGTLEVFVAQANIWRGAV
jgi:hypothetical protein